MRRLRRAAGGPDQRGHHRLGAARGYQLYAASVSAGRTGDDLRASSVSAEVGCVVVGAGVVGLAVARALAQAGMDVVVLEQASAIGTGISSRSSEVIHAGLYYPPESWRARLCVAGREALYRYCAAHGVAARRCGKLVVATSEAECNELDRIRQRGQANGAGKLELLTAAQARALEPALACAGALLSPETGIVDSHGLMLSLRGEAEAAGAAIALRTRLESAEARAGGFDLRTGSSEPMHLRCRNLVNAAGLGATDLAKRINGLDAAHVPEAYLSKGSYFTFSGKAPFNRLIYPVPIPGGAGIHLTFDLAGQARFGPDVEAVDRTSYDVDPARAAGFAQAIRRYWPELPAERLSPAYAGLRPKIVPADQTQDFVIQGDALHGLPGLVNLFGIESPGLTSSLAIADLVKNLIIL